LPHDPGRSVLFDGTAVGQYSVEFLTLGGMSVVYRSELDGAPVVLKEVPADNTVEVPSLMMEKSLLERLDHTGILGYRDFFSEQGYYYLVVDYVEGEPLSQRIGGRDLSAEHVVEWGSQLCDIFYYLHQQSPPIIYRDLKPANVMVRRSDGKLVLVDFGIARLHKGGRQQDTMLFGSIQTASPEHYGRGETDERSDIFTLGMTMYLCLTGGGEGTGIKVRPLGEVRPDLPTAVSQAVTRAIELEPEARQQSMMDLKAELRSSVGLPVEKEVEQAVDRVPPSRKLPVFASAVLLLALIVWGGYELYSTRAPQAGQPIHYSGPSELEEVNFPVDLFSAGTLDDWEVVMLGEDIGLFAIESSNSGRSEVIAERLNHFYRQFCPLCGQSKLEPEDIKIGRHVEANAVVLFYAHTHEGGSVAAGPILLATATEKEAAELKTTPRFMAGHWRDLMRDTIQVSRGLGSRKSALGERLENALIRARKDVEVGKVDSANLRLVLQELKGNEAFALRRVFQFVPQDSPERDSFQSINGFEPLLH
jgi:serine/threonine protein kinase